MICVTNDRDDTYGRDGIRALAWSLFRAPTRELSAPGALRTGGSGDDGLRVSQEKARGSDVHPRKSI